jgi:hypothetical protein
MGVAVTHDNYLNVGFDYLNADDQALATAAVVSGNGYSIWATRKYPFANGSSWEALLRYDHWVPNISDDLAPPSTAPLPGPTKSVAIHGFC